MKKTLVYWTTLQFLSGWRTRLIALGLTIRGVIQVIDGDMEGWTAIAAALATLTASVHNK